MATRHHEIQRWVDFGRGLLDGEEAAAMRRHLDQGCPGCAPRFATVRRMADLARVEAEMPLPRGDLRRAKSIAGLAPSTAAGTGPRDLRLKRIFDSTVAPLPAGARRQAAPDRQLVFEAPDYTLHLHLEPRAESAGQALAGQLRDRDGAPPAGVPACLLAADGAARYLATGEDGGFELTADFAGVAELRFLVDDDLRITAELRA